MHKTSPIRDPDDRIIIEDFKRVKTEKGIKFIYKPEPKFEFNFYEYSGSYELFTTSYTVWQTGFPSIPNDKPKQVVDWIETLDNWFWEIRRYAYEQRLSDFWEELDEVIDVKPKLLSQSFTNVDFGEDELFNDDEKKLLRNELEQATENIKVELDLDPDKLTKIETALQELNTKIDELTKFNWKSTAAGILKDVIVDSAKDAFTLNSLISLFRNLLDSGPIFLS